jgi:hypothetical protein
MYAVFDQLRAVDAVPLVKIRHAERSVHNSDAKACDTWG